MKRLIETSKDIEMSDNETTTGANGRHGNTAHRTTTISPAKHSTGRQLPSTVPLESIGA